MGHSESGHHHVLEGDDVFEQIIAANGDVYVLYRLALPWRITLDRPPGYGRFEYFIHMRDASHPEREFIEWVDPKVGEQRNAELCQARAFGITLDDWLNIEQEG